MTSSPGTPVVSVLILSLAPMLYAAEAVDTAPERGIFVDLIQSVRECAVGVRGVRRGSGVALTPEGLIVTAASTVGRKADGTISVLLAEGHVEEATLVGIEVESGIAFIKIDATDLPCLPLDGTLPDPVTGELVITLADAVGSIDRDYQVAASVGVVHGSIPLLAKGKLLAPVFEVEAAATNNGNAGGAVIDSRGRLRGILNDHGVHRVGTFLGTAIPVSRVKQALERIEAGTRLEPSFLGGSFQKRQVEEVVVSQVPEGSPLERAGLERGDVLLDLAGTRIKSPAVLQRITNGLPPGSRLPLLVRRRGVVMSLELEVGELPPPGYLGVEWDDDDRSGLKVATLKPDSPARRQEGRSGWYLKPGDRVLRINGVIVNDLDDLDELRSQLVVDAEVRIRFKRRKSEHTFKLRLPEIPVEEPETPAEGQ